MSIHPFHYYVITSHYLVQIEQNQAAAWVENSSGLIRRFIQHFQALLEDCEVLAHCASNALEVLETYSRPSSRDLSMSMLSQPCFGRYFTADIIKKYLCGLESNEYQTVFEMAEKRYGLIRAMEGNFYTVFTEKGLHDFAKRGVLAEVPSQYVTPIGLDDRRKFLYCLREEIEKGTVTGLIVRPSRLHIPDYLALYTDSMGEIHFDTTEDFIYGAYYCDIHIPEEFVCEALRDFIQYLPNSPLVYSKEDTLRILDEEIQGLSR